MFPVKFQACFKSKDSWEVRVKIQDQVTNPLLTPKGILLTSFGCVFSLISFRFPTTQPTKKNTHHQQKQQQKIKRSQRFLHRGQKKTNRCFLVVSPIMCWGFIIKSRRCQRLITVSLDRKTWTSGYGKKGGWIEARHDGKTQSLDHPPNKKRRIRRH